MKIESYFAECLLQLNNQPRKEQDLRTIFLSILRKDHSWLINHRKNKLNPEEIKKISTALKKLKAGQPLAYVLGQSYFYNLKLKSSPAALIPRPETEIMVNLILEEVKRSKKKEISLVDIGCGSGAIILALAHNLSSLKNKKINFWAADISSRALKLAKENSHQLGLDKKIKFYLSDLSDFIKKTPTYLIMAANLPYLNKEEMLELSIKKEPPLALEGGGPDGLNVYRRLLKKIKNWSTDSHLSLYLEINPQQKTNLKEIVQKTWPKAIITVKKDLRRQDRFLVIKKPSHP